MNRKVLKYLTNEEGQEQIRKHAKCSGQCSKAVTTLEAPAVPGINLLVAAEYRDLEDPRGETEVKESWKGT